MAIKIRKSEKQRIQEIITTIMLSNREVEINTPSEHRIAEELVKAGEAVVVAKKNYGRIAKIKGTQFALEA